MEQNQKINLNKMAYACIYYELNPVKKNKLYYERNNIKEKFNNSQRYNI